MLKKIQIVKIDSNYCDYLRQYDNRVPYNAGIKELRPFIGILFKVENCEYFAPLSSPKPKHSKLLNTLDVIKIADGKLGIINFNNMIPVSNDVIQKLDIRPSSSDTPKEREYKELLNNQLDWCNDNIDNIIKKANKLYRLITQSPEKSINLTRRCCDFKKLEAVLERRLAKAQSNEYEPKEKAVAASAEIPVRHPVIIRRRKNTGRSR